ncbi:MAG: bifunctional pyr operon transcriptional regulator/uracil phosphoribosyltransferase PyrR [Pseudomonadota bacterium]
MANNQDITSDQVNQWLSAMATELQQLIDNRHSDKTPRIVGIRTGGVVVARALHERLNLPDPHGELNISFYRDDFSRIGLHPQVGASDIPFSIDDEIIILVDDVLYSGRTIRAAMNEIFDYGRPERIILATLVSRSEGRELPISADVSGAELALPAHQNFTLQDNLSLTIEARTCQPAPPQS